MIDRRTVLALYDRELRIDVNVPGLFKEISGGVVRFMGPPDRQGSNFVLYCRLTADNADEAIIKQINHYRYYRMPFEWKVYDHDTPPDLKARLLAHGFKLQERDAVMVLNTQEAGKELVQPIKADVRKLTRPEQIATMIQLLQEVWQVDFIWLQRLLEEDLWKRPTYSSIYMAYIDDIPASVGWIQFPANSQFATLWGGTTLPQFRRTGLYRAVLAIRVQEAIRRGCSFITFDASRNGRAISEKYGFELLTFAHSCIWEPVKS